MSTIEKEVSYLSTPKIHIDEAILGDNGRYSIKVNKGLYANLVQDMGARDGQLANTSVRFEAGLQKAEEFSKQTPKLGVFDRSKKAITVYPDWAFESAPNDPDLASYIASVALIHETSHALDDPHADAILGATLGLSIDLKSWMILYEGLSLLGEQLAVPSMCVWGATIVGAIASTLVTGPTLRRLVYSIHPYEIKARSTEQLIETNPDYAKLVEIQPKY